ncbi:MAG: hypothetical protein K2H46_07570 [Muribaculaceae bacterium]|nr:hypothetical protein [Muribaculaceae bacterium]
MRKIFTVLMLAAAIFSGVWMVGANLKSGNSVSASSDNREEICDTAYNKMWLDSIPYLIENAKLLKHWAYEALGDCYANGRGGVDKNIMEAIGYYNEAGVDIDNKLSHSLFAEEWKTLNTLLTGIAKKDLSDEEALKILKSMPAPRPKWAEFLKKILLSAPNKREHFILSSFPHDLDSEETLVGTAYLEFSDSEYSFEKLLREPEKNLKLIRLICKKISTFNNLAANDLWLQILHNPELAEKYAPLALEFSYEADRRGLLTRYTIMWLMNYVDSSGLKKCQYFSEEDFNRFRSLYSPEELENLKNVEGVVDTAVVLEEEMIEEAR